MGELKRGCSPIRKPRILGEFSRGARSRGVGYFVSIAFPLLLSSETGLLQGYLGAWVIPFIGVPNSCILIGDQGCCSFYDPHEQLVARQLSVLFTCCCKLDHQKLLRDNSLACRTALHHVQ